MQHQLLDYRGDLVTSVGDRAVQYTQEIPDQFLAATAEMRAASSQRAGESHMVASIPAAVVDLWKHQGFDVFTAPAREILKRLRAENLQAFITTDKRI